MRIRAGYELTYEHQQPTPMLLMLRVHPSRRTDLLTDEVLRFTPAVQAHDYIDAFGNACTRILAPAGSITISTEFVTFDHGRPDLVAPAARQHDIGEIPDDVLLFLLGSRYCDTDRLADFAWATFGATPPGWARVQAIATSCTATSGSTTRPPIRSAPRQAASRTAPASAATSPTSRSRSAAA